MGTLYDFNIDGFADDAKLDYMVETGTFQGKSVKLGILSYKEVHSIEICEKLYNENIERFKNNPSVHLYLGSSCDMLPVVLGNMKKDSRVLFWLDAHHPELYEQGKYSEEQLKDLILPLKEELEIIKKCKDTTNDIFIIDDLHMYTSAKFLTMRQEELHKAAKDIQFITDLFYNTHIINIEPRKDGYICILPRSTYCVRRI